MIKVIQFGDLEPSCPSCKNANAMLSWYDGDKPCLQCRDCGFTVKKESYEIEVVEPIECLGCGEKVWPTAKACANCNVAVPDDQKHGKQEIDECPHCHHRSVRIRNQLLTKGKFLDVFCPDCDRFWWIDVELVKWGDTPF